MEFIPFNKPCLVGNELEYVSQAIRNGHIAGDGPFTRRCERLLQEILGVEKVLLTTSCTHALEMAAFLLRIAPGDEVILPSFTFVSTANAFVLRGARPVFVDIRPDTLNIDEKQLERAITPQTRAIVPVHYAGVGCEMETILAIAGKQGIPVVEDNAHGLCGRYKGSHLGTFGSLATLSFHETKNFTCGEGGGLIINDPSLVARAEVLRANGTNRSRFLRGEVDRYTWVDMGSNYLPPDSAAAFLLAQLESREHILEQRKRVFEYYADHLGDWAQSRRARLPTVPPECEHPYHIFYLLMSSFEERQALIEHLKAHGILSVFHYVPLHLSAMGRSFGCAPRDLPVTEDLGNRLIRLPFYIELRPEDQERICEAIHGFQG